MSDIDFSQQAMQLSQFLAPYVPYLLKGFKLAGQKAFEKLGEKVTEAGWEKAKILWEKLHPQVKQQPEAEKALLEAAQTPDDPRTEAVISWQLEKVLKTLPPDQIMSMVEIINAPGQSIQVNVNKGNVTAGRDMKDNIIITGDKNQV